MGIGSERALKQIAEWLRAKPFPSLARNALAFHQMLRFSAGNVRPPAGGRNRNWGIATHICQRGLIEIRPNNASRRGAQAPFRAIDSRLEVEADFSSYGPRRDIVSSAERGEVVVEGLLVQQVYGRNLQAPFVMIAMKQIVVAHG